MTDTDRPRFARLLVALSETFNEPISEVRADVYFQTLSEFDVESVEHAAHRLLRTATFFPKPAEFVTLLEGDVADQGELALARITAEVQSTGFYGRPRLSHDDYDLVQRVWGGWQGLCSNLPAKGTEAFQWERKRFLEMHSAVQGQRLRDGIPALTGAKATALLEQITASVKAMDSGAV